MQCQIDDENNLILILLRCYRTGEHISISSNIIATLLHEKYSIIRDQQWNLTILLWLELLYMAFCVHRDGYLQKRAQSLYSSLRASICENLPSLRHSNVFLENFQKQTAKSMLELNRSNLLVLTDSFYRVLSPWGIHGKNRSERK